MRASAKFALGSCQYPWGILDAEPAQASWLRLARRLEATATADRAQAVLLLGDQVYLDATAGLFDPTAHFERYTRPYRRLEEMAARGRATNTLGLATYCMLDDHEIEENWERLAGDREGARALEAGRAAYVRHQRAANRPDARPRGDSEYPLWFTFELGALPFFMADTRTEREGRTAANIESARIMSKAQFRALTDWLDAQHQKRKALPKFIASPAILLPRRLRATQNGHVASALRSDAWHGYPFSLHALLAHIAENAIENVVFLSGDEHLSCVARASIESPTGKRALIHSVHASALYAPFPFANSREEDLAADEAFGFKADGGEYRCSVQTQFAPPGDGFCILSLAEDAGRWTMRCEFDRDPTLGPAQAPIVRPL